MADQLSPQVVARLEQLCRRVRVSREIDEEVHRELMGHLYDKLLAYLHGSEKMSEEDALLLVERHFGNAEEVQNLLRQVHATANEWVKRLMIVALFALMADFPGTVLQYFVFSSPTGHAGLALDFYLGGMLANLAALVAMWYLLCRWQMQIANGRVVWFMRWRSSTIAAVLATAMAAYWSITFYGPHFIAPSWDGGGWEAGMTPHPLLVVAGVIIGTFSMMAFAIQGILWIWWTDGLRGKRSAVLTTSVAWGAFCVITWFGQMAMRAQLDLSGLMIVAALTIAAVVAALYAGFYDFGRWLLRRVTNAQVV